MCSSKVECTVYNPGLLWRKEYSTVQNSGLLCNKEECTVYNSGLLCSKEECTVHRILAYCVVKLRAGKYCLIPLKGSNCTVGGTPLMVNML